MNQLVNVTLENGDIICGLLEHEFIKTEDVFLKFVYDVEFDAELDNIVISSEEISRVSEMSFNDKFVYMDTMANFIPEKQVTH